LLQQVDDEAPLGLETAAFGFGQALSRNLQ
jgi:hypothetical protein